MEKDGCNPIVVEEKEQTDNKIIIKTEYADTFGDKFVNWKGIIE